ncbi:mite group 2 allergen Tyr p 2-like [Tropilaelaps mercedesae]|uniref:Mite group 2 allergen Tyr p 2-like n=1 Tax=Tropilaelaps mercedesae TaxID=418985 RepID=A0A1V9XGT4_9ACAR|nr:mite group 2 allergen Tyr p 2-like [Tropilaelaps mercedesae]
MLRLSVIVFLAISAFGQQVVVPKKCAETGGGILKKLVVSPCTAEPCVMKKGRNATLTFEYIADQNSTTAVIDARVKAFGMKVPVPGIDTDLCKIISCPVKEGATYTAQITVPVPKIPIKKTTLEVKIIGDKGLSSCFTHPLFLK